MISNKNKRAIKKHLRVLLKEYCPCDDDEVIDKFFLEYEKFNEFENECIKGIKDIASAIRGVIR